MKELSCGDVMQGCEAKFRANTEEEVMRKAATHARERHGINEMDSNTAELVRSKIRNV
jgi:predicted small metal-binding protein